MSSNTQVLIAAVPDGPLAAEHFQVQEDRGAGLRRRPGSYAARSR